MSLHITYFVHGTTTDNENGIATGQLPGELSKLGVEQAKKLGQLVKDKKFDAVFCADLKRAVDSAKLVFGDKCEIIQDKRLREINYGDWNGKKNDFKDDLADYIDKPFPNGESYKDVEKRMREFLRTVSRDYNNKHVAFVAHQAPQLALEVICNSKSWNEAIAEDWRKVGEWQAGWEYIHNYIDSFEKLFVDISLYEDPKMLNEDARETIDASHVNIKDLKKYRLLIFNINKAFKKVQRYPVYFETFYPSTHRITKYEALEHHLHAYLEDLDGLRNKITTLLSTLKNDLKRIATNKKEVEGAIKHMITKVEDAFSQVKNFRHPHHHVGPKFIDGDLVNAEVAHTFNQPGSPLSRFFKPEFIQKMRQREIDSIEKSRTYWVETAKNNNAQLLGLIEHVSSRNADWIYQYLKIKPIVNQLIDKSKSGSTADVRSEMSDKKLGKDDGH
jgi:alpha-ribazole phosphatase/probable phosphoglycerate mutase